VVDAGRQTGNQAGTVHLFTDGGFARVVDIDAPETYPQCSTYRRNLVMVDVDAERSYFVDFFTVEGGGQHDYSLHGCPGDCEIVGGSWDAQEGGTLAGPDVPVGTIYDDATLGAENYKGMFQSYRGSGFQHMINVRRHTGGDWFAHFSHEKDPAAKVRIRPLNPDDAQAILTNAQVSPVKHKELLTYLIALRTGEDLKSRFAAVLEPFRGDPFIKATRRIDVADACAVVVELSSGETDMVLSNPLGNPVTLPDLAIQTDAPSAVVRLDASGAPAKVFFAAGSALSVGDQAFEATSLRGNVVSVDPQACQISIGIPAGGPALVPENLVGRVVHFQNDIRRTAHAVAAASLKGDLLTLTTKDDLLVGRAPITAVEP
jgi:hypothetical protein